jgi:signal transduction histidine kinase
MNDLILEVVKELMPVSEHYGITIQTLLDPDLPCGMLDAVRMRYALRNVIDNAIRFSKTDGVVDIWTALSAQRGIVVTVADRGVGICREDLDHVFQPSQKRTPLTARRNSGAGIGLALAKKCVECNQGSIWLTSKPDIGTTVEITLPLGAAPCLPEAAKSSSSTMMRIAPQRPVSCLPQRGKAG